MPTPVLNIRASIVLLIAGLGVVLGSARPASAQLVSCKNIQQIPEKECEALLAFYIRTNGLEWIRASGWGRSRQPCSWFGVACTAGTLWPLNVTKINLPSNNVGGSLPPEIGNLTRLRELVIENRLSSGDFVRLGGSLIGEVAQLTELEVLRLSDNALRGTIPQELGRLTKLRVLNLDGNQFETSIPIPLTNLGTLEELDLSRNDLGGFMPPELGRLTNLRRLHLNDNQFERFIPPELGNLTVLEILDLSRNDLRGPVPGSFLNLTHLFRLDLSGNNLDGSLPLDLAAFAAGLSSCGLADNPNLCIPDTPPFRAIGVNPICDLALTRCSGSLPPPVETFGSVTEGAVVRLIWTVGAGLPGGRFEVEQQVDGRFQLLAVRDVAEPVNEDLELSHTVEDLPPGRYTFRLKQTDPAGTIAYSAALEVVFLPVGGLLLEAAYPNPFRTATSLRLVVAQPQQVRVELYDAMGRRVRTLHRGQVDAEEVLTVTIDAASLGAGLYVVRATGAIETHTRRIALVR